LLKIIKTEFFVLKTRKYHIIYSWVLLVCFITGQYMVYAHQHNVVKGPSILYAISKNVPQQTVKEKCSLCDVMHHNSMVAAVHSYFPPVSFTGHAFKSETYNFTSIQLILAGGRAPPTSLYSV
jgi:hypothetical protein